MALTLCSFTLCSSMNVHLGELGPLVTKIHQSTAGELKHLRCPETRIAELEEARQKLEAKEKEIDDRDPSEETTKLSIEVKKLKDEINKIRQDFQHCRCLCGSSWNCYSVNQRLDKTMDEVENMIQNIPEGAIDPAVPKCVPFRISEVTIGMEEYKKEILGYIANRNDGVIGIYGMAGIGKTTFLRDINNSNVDGFDYVIWLEASKGIDVTRLQASKGIDETSLQLEIAERLNKSLGEIDSVADRGNKLIELLKNKDCLLLLDDLWDTLDLQMLGMAPANSGRTEQQKRKVVVFTTCDKQVCDRMGAKKMEIKSLENKQAWDLFMRYCNKETIESDPGMKHLAEQLVKQCDGHPLFLVTLGKAMSGKCWEGCRPWIKDSQRAKVTGNNEDMLAWKRKLKLRYDNLPDEGTKGGLLSCIMWPRGSIKIDELIECWMGLGLFDGLFDGRASIYDIYNKGKDYINTLKDRHLLEPGNNEREVKMHDLIREMALWVACEENKFKWIIRAAVEASQAVEKEGWHEAERASLMCTNIKSLTNLPSTFPKLSVLLLRCNNKLEEIRGPLIKAMSALTYLDLEQTEIKVIPKEIGKLSQLQHLNLSSTPIIKLPKELGHLVNLKHLLLRHTSNLTLVAKGAISGLSSLKLLDLRGSGYEDCWNELKNLQENQKYIAIDIKTAGALKNLCSLSCVLIWRLNVKTLRNSANMNQLLDDIIKSCNTWQSMEQLTIEDVKMNESLISEENNLECMQYLELKGLNLLEEIKWNGVQPKNVFPYLRELIISRCKILRDVNWALQLPSLSVLDISCCEVMKELISDKSNSSSNFAPKRIRLSQMPNLKSISATPLRFPCCEEITIQTCPLLTKLLFEKDSMERLTVIRCEQAWWDNLQWEDDEIKGKLSPFVKRSEG